MPKLVEVARIGNKPIYQDVNGNICTEDNSFSYLIPLSTEEEDELLESVGFGSEQKAKLSRVLTRVKETMVEESGGVID